MQTTNRFYLPINPLVIVVATIGILLFAASSFSSFATDAPQILAGFEGASGWTAGGPVTAAQTKNKVVVVDFYTSRCSNCLAAVPHVAALYAKYRDEGLIVVGVHTPEMDSERSPEVVNSTIKRLGIKYPVALDNNSAIWNKFRSQYWPNLLIYDKSGRLVYSHAGEGQYEEIDQKVKSLL